MRVCPLLIWLAALQCVAGKTTYTGDQVWEIFARTQDDIRELHQLESDMDGAVFDMWRPPSLEGAPAQVHLAASHLDKMADILRSAGIEYRVKIEDLQRVSNAADADQAHKSYQAHSWKAANSHRHRRDFDENASEMTNDIVGNYATYDQILDWMRRLEVFFPDEVQLIVLDNKTYEGRDIVVLKVGKPIQGVDKPGIWLDGAVHAREWVSPASLIYTIYQLLDAYQADRPEKDLVEKVDWYIMVVGNPDGYVYSHTKDRFWRKNRQFYEGAGIDYRNRTCVGVDLNRNFPFHWNEGGSSANNCSSVYHGPSPGSEAETQAIMSFLLSRRHLIKAYFAVHSYGQLVTTRWGYSADVSPPDHEEMVRVGTNITKAIRSVYGTNFTFGVSPKILYGYSGGSPDWAKGVANITYSFAFELRDRGSWGFLLPLNQTLPAAREAYAGVTTMAWELVEQYQDVLSSGGVGAPLCWLTQLAAVLLWWSTVTALQHGPL